MTAVGCSHLSEYSGKPCRRTGKPNVGAVYVCNHHRRAAARAEAVEAASMELARVHSKASREDLQRQERSRAYRDLAAAAPPVLHAHGLAKRAVSIDDDQNR